MEKHRLIIWMDTNRVWHNMLAALLQAVLAHSIIYELPNTIESCGVLFMAGFGQQMILCIQRHLRICVLEMADASAF